MAGVTRYVKKFHTAEVLCVVRCTTREERQMAAKMGFRYTPVREMRDVTDGAILDGFSVEVFDASRPGAFDEPALPGDVAFWDTRGIDWGRRG